MGDHSWSFVGLFVRVLPREFRERVVEPAYNDLLVEELAVSRNGKNETAPYPIWSRVGFVLSCFRVGLPRFFWHAGRPTVLMSLIALTMLVAGLLVFVVGPMVVYGPQGVQ